MKPVLKLIRHAQWRWDYPTASHGGSFHAPLETSRLLSTSIDKAHEARLLLAKIHAKYGFTGTVEIPDISTKEKAQKAIGLDMDKLRQDKKEFIEKILPEWDRKAKEREASLGGL